MHVRRCFDAILEDYAYIRASETTVKEAESHNDILSCSRPQCARASQAAFIIGRENHNGVCRLLGIRFQLLNQRSALVREFIEYQHSLVCGSFEKACNLLPSSIVSAMDNKYVRSGSHGARSPFARRR